MSRRGYPDSQSVRRRVLDNGLTILAFENFDSGTVVVEGLVRAGGIADTPGKEGLADFTADLLMRGTALRSFEAIYELLESCGAGLSFGAQRHTTRFAAAGLAEDFDMLVTLMRESLREPAFPDDHVELVRGQSITGLRMRKNDTGSMARLTFMEKVYEGHPYGRSLSGYEDTVAAISRQDLVDFHRTYYGPVGMLVVVAGAVAAAEVFAQLEAAFGDWRNPAQPTLPHAPDAPPTAAVLRHHVVMPDKVQCGILMGLPGPRRSAADYLDVSLMNTVLGVFGSMGRIGQNVRERQGLAYYASSRLEGGVGPAPWTAAAGVAPENVERAIQSIRDEVNRMREEPVLDDELADSKAYRIGGLPMGLETNAGIAGVVTDLEFYGLGQDYLLQLPDLLNEITPERIQAAARKYLDPEHMMVVVAGPEAGPVAGSEAGSEAGSVAGAETALTAVQSPLSEGE